MQCNRCKNEAVLFQAHSGRHLCSNHLVRDIEARAKRSIRSNGWMRSADHIGILMQSDLKSAALALFLKRLVAGRRDVQLSAIIASDTTDMGKKSRATASTFAESLGINCMELSALDGSVTRIAVPASLDDIAQRMLSQFLFGDADRLANPSGTALFGIPVICPFITIPSNELALYWELAGTRACTRSPSIPPDVQSQETVSLLEDYSRRHPATCYAILRLSRDISSGREAAVAADAWLNHHVAGER